MGNCFSCCKSNGSNHMPTSSTPEASVATTVEEVKRHFEAVDVTGNGDDLIDAITHLLRAAQQKDDPDQPSTSSQTSSNIEQGSITLTSVIQSGETFLKFADGHIDKIDNKENLFHSDGGEATKVLSEILQQVGQLHWIVGGLSIIAYLVNKIDKVTGNRKECLELLKCMLQLAAHIKKLKDLMPQEQEKLRDALRLIVQGAMMCASLLSSHKFFSFLRTSVDSTSVSSLGTKINHLYRDLTLATSAQTLEISKATKQEQPVLPPILQPDYPNKAVGLEARQEEVIKLLKTDDLLSRTVVVLYGFGGVGKTTLADAVVSKLDLQQYNYSSVQIDAVYERNNFEKLQAQILKDAFPNYRSRQTMEFRNSKEGRQRLALAFSGENNKPVFLVIDNALRAQDLEELLPEDMQGLPKGSKILVTTRTLEATNMLIQSSFPCHHYLVHPLPHADAKKFLLIETANHMEDNDVQRILEKCKGIPLVLKIVTARLRKQGYRADKCSQILEALEKGTEIKEDDLSERLVGFVYKGMESSTKEAFLDICCFVHKWRRRMVEYIVGAEELTSLQEAALITTEMQWSRTGGARMREEVVIVHDVIREKGRSMSESSRIMDLRSLKYAIQQKRTKEIKGVWLRGDYKSEYVFEEEDINSMRISLRVLFLGRNMSFTGRSKTIFEELRYLGIWPSENRFLRWNLEGMKRLGVYRGGIMVEGVSLLYKLPANLKAIKAFSQSEEYTKYGESRPMQVVPNSSLEELDLSNLKKLPDGLLNLKELRILRLDEWDEMEELPEVVCELRSLRTLSMVYCRRLKRLPESFAQLNNLEDLNLLSCTSLEELPSNFGKLEALKYLNLRACVKLRKWPDGIEQLTSLVYLDLRGCPLGQQNDSKVENLSKRRELEIKK